MKKFFYLLLACCLIGFTACGGDDDNDDGGGSGGDVKKYEEYEYSNLTVSQQKEKIQEDANDLLNEFEALKTNEAIKVLTAFPGWTEDDPSNLEPDYNWNLKSSTDIVKIADNYGIYTWDDEEENWVETSSSDHLEYRNFPVGENQRGRIVITAVSSGVYAEENGYYYDYEIGEYEEVIEKTELPKEIKVKIYLGNKEVGSAQVNSEIKNTTTMPSVSSAVYNLGDYTMSTNVTKASPNTAVSTFKKGNTVLLEAKADISGNIDQIIEDDDYTNGGDIKGNVVINIYNKLVIAGNMDIRKYLQKEDELGAIYENSDYDESAEKAYIEGLAKAFNDNSELFLVSLKEETRIATLEMKAKPYKEYSWTYWETVPALRFGDKSLVEAETFFSSGFNLFIQNFKDFLDSFDE